MAWNPSPEVAIARDAAKQLKADRVVIMFTTADGKLGYASYGETKSKCNEAKGMADTLFDSARKWCEAFL